MFILDTYVQKGLFQIKNTYVALQGILSQWNGQGSEPGGIPQELHTKDKRHLTVKYSKMTSLF